MRLYLVIPTTSGRTNSGCSSHGYSPLTGLGIQLKIISQKRISHASTSSGCYRYAFTRLLHPMTHTIHQVSLRVERLISHTPWYVAFLVVLIKPLYKPYRIIKSSKINMRTYGCICTLMNIAPSPMMPYPHPILFWLHSQSTMSEPSITKRQKP